MLLCLNYINVLKNVLINIIALERHFKSLSMTLMCTSYVQFNKENRIYKTDDMLLTLIIKTATNSSV